MLHFTHCKQHYLLAMNNRCAYYYILLLVNEKLLHIRHYQKLIPLFQRPPWHIHMSFALKLHTYSNRWQNERLVAQSFKLKQQNNDMLQVRSLMAEISSWSHRLMKNCYNFGLMKRLVLRWPVWKYWLWSFKSRIQN